ncbi:hypothetical protein F5148DRAFT_1292359 [Russula earlei]|uniref:Uncharacterized protein n=1 Tax=Russula earlei TaxID=71964 RepID=A0ACC0TTD6_9AGAM|nr:hypothetical protein F5148DRAFT_1292359 [Russula earlei]
MSVTARSHSRGRSFGRGGVGNFRDPSSGPVPDDCSSDIGGRELNLVNDPNKVISTGRGGIGNIRSPSRDASIRDNASMDSSPRSSSEVRGRSYDRDLIIAIDKARDSSVVSTGRGGAGNIVDSRTGSQSRSRSREPSRSTGRGGVGNLLHLGGLTEKRIEELDESERAAHAHPVGLHSVGRGGSGNVTLGELPHLDNPVIPHGHPGESSGRGGSGNISRDPSPHKSRFNVLPKLSSIHVHG